jgi:hypothetical protein
MLVRKKARPRPSCLAFAVVSTLAHQRCCAVSGGALLHSKFLCYLETLPAETFALTAKDHVDQTGVKASGFCPIGNR